ncbi:cytochrome P450 [Helicobacter muridarum]|uniref:Cytochrome P450 n=1 Tax=Helicobacter muridarum TaxID=216 RepID=A0A4U8TIP5_9HELI|nr:cytochrome P450 [Helicobacter muridarum]TLD99915.1 cytochrome P450 [Helicobacter muridarum]
MTRYETINFLNNWRANFSQNICKELVHKFFNSEVFLTDSHKISHHSFLVSAFLPQTPIYYNDIPNNLAHNKLLFFPSLWDLLLRDKSILNSTIDELLRLTNLGTTSTFPRITTADIDLSSFILPKDSVVYADVFLANRDPLIFDNPFIDKSF